MVNKSKAELGLKRAINKEDWNPGRGSAKPKTPELKQLNSYLEEVRARMVTYYQRLDLKDEHITAEAVKNSYLGLGAGRDEEKMTLNKFHEMYPYLLKSIDINYSNQVLSIDITYIPLQKGFLYKTAFIDWHSRYLLSYAIANTLDAGFAVDAFRAAVKAYGVPDIVNLDQGSQFTFIFIIPKDCINPFSTIILNLE